MFKEQNFCHIASNNRNNVKVGVFVYRTSDDLANVTVSGYFNERIIDINLHDIIIHEKIDPVDSTVVQRNTLCVVKRTVDNVETKEIHSAWEELTDQAIQNIQNALANIELNDLTDVNINNVQVGDYLRWNGAKWINMSGGGGGSAVWGSVGGDIEDQADLQLALADKANVDLDNLSATGQAKFDAKANVDMDNLTDTGANIANWSHNVTNCITKIPQDIILELNAGTLTLKAGSKAYNANGLLVTTTNDLNVTWATTGTANVVVTANGQNLYVANYPGETVSTLPSPTTSYKVYFNTTDGKCYFDDGTMKEVSFPVAVITANGQINDIKYTFNGFGYIGSTVFALPGVKGLIPDGRNADGTLKNTPYTINEVTTLTFSASYTHNDVECGFLSGTTNANYYTYKEPENCIYIGTTITQRPMNCVVSVLNGTITSFKPKTVFHAFDYNDLMVMTLNTLYPVGSIYIGTQSTCPLATLIPGSTWTQIQGRYLLASGTLAGTSETRGANAYVAAGQPNILGRIGRFCIGDTFSDNTLFWYNNDATYHLRGGGNDGTFCSMGFSIQNVNSIYGQSATIRPTAYTVNVWRRTA